MDLRERKQERARREIVEAAFELFKKHGFDDTTVEMIAERALVSPRTIYRYFRTKESIVFAGLDGEHDRLTEMVRHHCADGVSVVALFDAFAEQFSRRQERERDFPTLTALMRDNPALMARADAWRRELAGRLADTLAQLRGTDVVSIEDRALAAMVVAVSAITVQEWAANDHRGDLGAMVLQAGRAIAEAPVT